MKELLIDDIIKEKIAYTTSKWVIEGIPYIFNNNLEEYIKWKEKLSTQIGVDSKAIILTGSSSVGYSLNPEKEFKAFDENSDIDIAIISNHYFDISWHFLRNIGIHYHRLKPKEKTSIDDHRQRLIYYGTIATDKIIHILPFGEKWMAAMAEMNKIEPTINREINFRIYKDFEALKSYQMIGINKVRDLLLQK